ncbi:MAG: alpha/beta hydrolase [Halioglobus sp.]|nr:alpha/beta hydrolase [Halioglobus sp.]
MSILRKYPKTFLALVVLAVMIAISYSWTFTPHGRLDYRAAVSLRLLSFERTMQPDPNVDFEVKLPVNLVYALSFALPKEDLQEISDIVIPARDAEIPARIYRPIVGAARAASLPVIVFYHGGGFVVGNIDIFDSLVRSLANATTAIVVSVGYRLAPANPYPAAVEDAYAALEWVSENIAALGGDGTKLVVAGESAGGNLAAVVALKARDERGPSIAGQILYYPALDFTDTDYPSRTKFIDGYGLSAEAGLAFQQAYAGHIVDKSEPYLSPIHAPSLANLPPTLMVTAGFDPLTDACIAYIERLQTGGATAIRRHFPGMIHGFMNIGVFPARREALDETSAFLHDLFPAAATGKQTAVEGSILQQFL